MNVGLELRNEANGVYGRQPEDRYQRLLLVGADYIDDLEDQIKRLRLLINEWADADDDPEDVNGVYHAAWLNLRRAVGR
jgi:hypothetical protein